MSRVYLSVRSLTSRVWSHQLWSEALSRATPDPIFPRRDADSPAFPTLAIVAATPHCPPIVPIAPFFVFVQVSANHSKPIGAGAVQRFCPIHF